MLGLSSFGMFHTAISLVAVAAGVVALYRYKEISLVSLAGRVYVAMTVLTCLTGFGIFAHGGFGKPHALGVITLVVLGVAYLAGRLRLFGWLSPYVESLSYSLTFYFHMIPAVAETSTRLPASAPLVASQEAPELQTVFGILFLVYLVGAVFQARNIRAKSRQKVNSGLMQT